MTKGKDDPRRPVTLEEWHELEERIFGVGA